MEVYKRDCFHLIYYINKLVTFVAPVLTIVSKQTLDHVVIRSMGEQVGASVLGSLAVDLPVVEVIMQLVC